MDVVDFPGTEARGSTTTAAPARRIPTVYSPFNAGISATLVEPMDEETTVFNLSNMTFLVANSTYEGLGESGLLNFFGLQDGQESDLLCVQNRCGFHRSLVVRLAFFFFQAQSSVGQASRIIASVLVKNTPQNVLSSPGPTPPNW